MTPEEIQERLLEIARADRRKTEHLANGIKLRDQFYADYVQAMADAVTKLETEPDELRAALRKDALQHLTDTGDMTIHDCITLRHTKKWVYPKGMAIEWCEDNAPHCLKTTLKVREFEKMLTDTDEIVFAEQVNSPTIAIGKVGHLLLVKDNEGDIE